MPEGGKHVDQSPRDSTPIVDADVKMRYADLQPTVRTYVDNLTEQMAQLVYKYEKKHPEELIELIDNGEMSIEDVRKFGALGKLIGEMFEKNRIPKEELRRELRELREQAEKLFDEGDRLFKEHLDLDQLSSLNSEDRIKCVAAYRHIGKPNPDFEARLSAFEVVNFFAFLGDFQKALEEVTTVRGENLQRHGLKFIATRAFQARNIEVTKKALLNVEPPLERSDLLENIIQTLAEEGKFEEAESFVPCGVDPYEKTNFRVTILEKKSGKGVDVIRDVSKIIEDFLDPQNPLGRLRKEELLLRITTLVARHGNKDDLQRVLDMNTKPKAGLITTIVPELVARERDEEAFQLAALNEKESAHVVFETYVNLGMAQANKSRDSDVALEKALNSKEDILLPYSRLRSQLNLSRFYLARKDGEMAKKMVSDISQAEIVGLSPPEKADFTVYLTSLAKNFVDSHEDPQLVLDRLEIIAGYKAGADLVHHELQLAEVTQMAKKDFELPLMYARETAEGLEDFGLLFLVAEMAVKLGSEYADIAFRKIYFYARKSIHVDSAEEIRIISSVILKKMSLRLDITKDLELFDRVVQKNNEFAFVSLEAFSLKMQLVNILLDRAEAVEREMAKT